MRLAEQVSWHSGETFGKPEHVGSRGSQKSPKAPVRPFIASSHMRLKWIKTLARSRQSGQHCILAPELSAVRVGPPHRVHWGQRDPGADAQTDRRHGAGQSVPTIKGNSPLSPSHPALLAGETPGGPDQFDCQDSLLAHWGSFLGHSEPRV